MFDFAYICRPAFCISLTINHPYIASYNSDSNNDIVITVLHVWSLYQHISCHNNESNDHVTLMTFQCRAGWEREGCLRVCWTGCLGLSALQWINIIQVQEGARFLCCVFNVLTLFDRQEGWSFRGGPKEDNCLVSSQCMVQFLTWCWRDPSNVDSLIFPSTQGLLNY